MMNKMKEMKRMMMVCFLMMASITLAMAQQNNDGKEKKRPSMEQFTQMQANRIAQQLAFDDKTTKKFVEAFCNCRKEIAATRLPHPKKKPGEMTDSEVDKSIKARFQQSRKILDIREKYYNAYSKFLSPKQIQRVYDLERNDFKHFAKKVFNKGPKGKGPDKCHGQGRPMPKPAKDK